MDIYRLFFSIIRHNSFFLHTVKNTNIKAMIPIVMGTVVGHICYNLGIQGPGWQKLCEGTKGLRRKVCTRTKILSPNICYIVAILIFVAIYTGQKKCFFGSKTVFLWQEVHHYMVYIAFYT